MTTATIKSRITSFVEQYQIDVPILLAPMAGACPPELSIAVAKAGGMGACGALLMQPEEMRSWAQSVSSATQGGFQINLWIPDPAPKRDSENENAIRTFLSNWGPAVSAEAADSPLPDFPQQCNAMLDIHPRVISSIMGVYPLDFIEAMKARGIYWFATVTTVAEAKLAEQAGADAIVAQGMEAGGHRGAFKATDAEANMVGLFSLLPAVVDAVSVPVIAAGGIADARGIAAALMLGAAAVQIGTGFLRTPEAQINSAWANALSNCLPEQTTVTRAFSGRAGRGIRNNFTNAMEDPTAPPPAPYPIQRNLTKAMRGFAVSNNDINGMQAWAGQSAKLATPLPAGELVQKLWRETLTLIDAGS